MLEPGAADLHSEPAPAPRGRWAANAFIALFLIYQIATPLGYYLSERVYDERFGWRMFSTVRLQRCELGIADVGADGVPRPARLGSTLHIAWINLLKRGWPAVVEKYLRTRCTAEDVVEARFERRCVGTDGTSLPTERFSMSCQSGAFQSEEPAR